MQLIRDRGRITAQVSQMSKKHICPQHLAAFKEEPRVWRPLSGREDDSNWIGLKSEIQKDMKAPHQDVWGWKPHWLEQK